MVSFKQLFVITSLLLSGIVAAPFPASELSVAAAEVRAIDDFAIESRGLEDDPIIDLDARNSKPKTKKPTKPKTKKPPTPKTAANGAVCPIKQPKKPRSLERRGKLFQAKDLNNIEENQFVLASSLKGASTVSVTDLSGCTALFFWDERNNPSAYHIFCGEEEEKAFQAASVVGDIGRAGNGVSIIAGTQTNYNNAKAGIVRYNSGVDEKIKVLKQDDPLYGDKESKGSKNDDKNKGTLKRWKVTAKVGDSTRTLIPVPYNGVSKQCQ